MRLIKSVFNIDLKPERLILDIERIVRRTENPPGMEIIVEGKHHFVDRSEYPGTEESWNMTRAGDQIELSTLRMPLSFRIIHRSLKQRVRTYLASAGGVDGYFFIWVCEHCDNNIGHVQYEDGDDFQSVKRKTEADHDREAKPDCDRSKIRIFDHRGYERKDEEKLLSLTKAK